MAGIYIHIPFCFSRCAYCDFYKTTKLDKLEPFLVALKSEIKHYSSLFQEKITTLYFGGGTPSLLKSSHFDEIFSLLRDSYIFSERIEITIECNPDDLTKDYIDKLLESGFNRISIGIQSFHEKDLQEMGRRHSSAQALQAIKDAYSGGFRNIGMDLIYGLPWSNIAAFSENLKIVKTLPINHLSAYHLTFEEGTPFDRLLKRGVYREITDSESLNQYELLREFATKEGFEHYEVSNFCKPGFRSRHNSSYWDGSPYIGFGPGSHSYFGGYRQWNKADLNLYLKSDREKIVEKEVLDISDRLNELIMLGLRTAEGVNLEAIEALDRQMYNKVVSASKKWLQAGNLHNESKFLKCNAKSWFVVDGIIKDLFV